MLKKPSLIFLATFVLLAGAGTLIANQRTAQQADPTPTPAPTVSPSATATAASATPSAATTPSPSASPSVTADELPITAFYAAFKAGEVGALAAYFTPDTSESDTFLHAVLFTGKDPSGNSGGPTLFVSSVVSDKILSTKVDSTTSPSTTERKVLISEQRRTAENKQITVIVEQEWVLSASIWKLSRYAKAGSTGKYDGFFTP